MKQTLKVKLDLYSLYEQMLDGVIVNITIEYDLENMIKHDIINQVNLKVIKKEFAKGLEYLESNPFSKTKILKDIDDHFKDPDVILETWTEDLPEHEFERIAYLIDDEEAHEVHKTRSMNEFIEDLFSI